MFALALLGCGAEQVTETLPASTPPVADNEASAEATLALTPSPEPIATPYPEQSSLDTQGQVGAMKYRFSSDWMAQQEDDSYTYHFVDGGDIYTINVTRHTGEDFSGSEEAYLSSYVDYYLENTPEDTLLKEEYPTIGGKQALRMNTDDNDGTGMDSYIILDGTSRYMITMLYPMDGQLDHEQWLSAVLDSVTFTEEPVSDDSTERYDLLQDKTVTLDDGSILDFGILYDKVEDNESGVAIWTFPDDISEVRQAARILEVGYIFSEELGMGDYSISIEDTDTMIAYEDGEIVVANAPDGFFDAVDTTDTEMLEEIDWLIAQLD